MEREEEVASHEQQLSVATKQQQTVAEELKGLWKELEDKQERWGGLNMNIAMKRKESLANFGIPTIYNCL